MSASASSRPASMSATTATPCSSAMCAPACRTASTASHAVLACFHMMIPHIMPELSAAAARRACTQRQDAARLHQRADAQLASHGYGSGVHDIAAPMSFHSRVKLDFPGQSRRLPSSARSFRADVPAPRPRAGRAQPGARCARRSSASARGRCSKRRLLISRPGSATSLTACSGPGGFSSATRYRGDHRQPLAARLRLRRQLAVRWRRLRERAGAGTAARGPGCHRQFRRRRRRLRSSCDRAGGARGTRAHGVM